MVRARFEKKQDIDATMELVDRRLSVDRWHHSNFLEWEPLEDQKKHDDLRILLRNEPLNFTEGKEQDVTMYET